MYATFAGMPAASACWPMVLQLIKPQQGGAALLRAMQGCETLACDLVDHRPVQG